MGGGGGTLETKEESGLTVRLPINMERRDERKREKMKGSFGVMLFQNFLPASRILTRIAICYPALLKHEPRTSWQCRKTWKIPFSSRAPPPEAEGLHRPFSAAAAAAAAVEKAAAAAAESESDPRPSPPPPSALPGALDGPDSGGERREGKRAG